MNVHETSFMIISYLPLVGCVCVCLIRTRWIVETQSKPQQLICFPIYCNPAFIHISKFGLRILCIVCLVHTTEISSPETTFVRSFFFSFPFTASRRSKKRWNKPHIRRWRLLLRSYIHSSNRYYKVQCVCLSIFSRRGLFRSICFVLTLD